MKKNFIFIFLAILQFHTSAKRTRTTLKISDRILLLKKQIRNSLRNPSPHDPAPQYYESDEDALIQPILDNDELKRNDRFKLAKIKTVPTTKATEKPVPKNDKKEKFLQILREYNIIRDTTLSPEDTHFIPVTPTNITDTTPKLGFNIFYRRYEKSVLANSQEWTHCTEHITPYLKGVRKELGKPDKVMEKDHIVHRLLNLIRANTTKMTRAEKRTTMYQISKLKIRLYNWHFNALLQLTTLISRLHGRSSSKFVRGSTLSTMSPPKAFADTQCRRRNAHNICIEP
ncbi:uncharacterized protein LOC125239443 [Leguminivora glycinivorella]|uniref:uncharacterized protein LOC125239443 n=1 Tax=Leguminivora glycinivorella TaxID=1035111 RepID=UPI00200CD9D6|nr:uncharacterized protein LOC125239443 [Leguminivora glycinivorella]XP_048002978.1 uncharacterized protein LOC125239443 [Leguminivora glycinivorella]